MSTNHKALRQSPSNRFMFFFEITLLFKISVNFIFVAYKRKIIFQPRRTLDIIKYFELILYASVSH